MKESLKWRKWAPSFISLVKILVGMTYPATWMTFRVLS
jgi:hypothetical protein